MCLHTKYYCTAINRSVLVWVLLFSSKFWYTVHPDIVHWNRKRVLLTQSTVREEFVEKVPGNCYNRLPIYSSPSAPPTIQQTGWFVQVSYDDVAFCLRMIRNGSRFSLICGVFESLSRTVTCAGELSALICVIPRGKDLKPRCLDYSL